MVISVCVSRFAIGKTDSIITSSRQTTPRTRGGAHGVVGMLRVMGGDGDVEVRVALSDAADGIEIEAAVLGVPRVGRAGSGLLRRTYADRAPQLAVAVAHHVARDVGQRQRFRCASDGERCAAPSAACGGNDKVL